MAVTHLACATRLYLQVVLRDDAHWDHFARMVDRGEIGRRGEILGEGGRYWEKGEEAEYAFVKSP